MANEAKKEEKKNRDLKKLIEGKIDEYGMTKKTLYSVFGILGCLLLTIVMSITGMGFNPDVFMTWNYWVGMIIQAGISIFSMVTGRQIGDDTQRNRPDGQYRKELHQYKEQYDRINEKNIFDYFEDWLETYRERKLQKKIRATLKDFGIKQMEVLDLDFEDLPNLAHPFVKDWTGTPFYEKYYDPKKGESKTMFISLTDVQLEALRKIMEGYVRIPNVSSSYFMNALKGTSVDEWERAAKADRKKGGQLASGYTYRIFMMVVMSLISNGLMSVPYEDQATMWLNIATRIFVLITSTVWGIYLGFKVVEMDIVFLAFKTQIIKQYGDEYERGTFRPETVKEQAEREVREYEEEQKKARESVIDPEVVESITGNGYARLEHKEE